MGIEWFGEPKCDPPVVVQFDPRWKPLADAWIERLRRILWPLDARIEHVGSTAVPGLAAKPVIDLQVAVPDLGNEPAYRPAIESLGLPLRARGLDHRFFRPPANAPRTIHVHVCEWDSAWEREHILFRDFLRAHRKRADEYATIKQRLAASADRDRARYGAGKSEFIARALRDAESWAQSGGRPA